MFFKNLQIYRLPAPWAITHTFEQQLSRKAFHPCGSQDFETRGWASPTGDDRLVHNVCGQLIIALMVETKILPASVIRQTAEDRAKEIEDAQGYKPGRKQMKELKEQITQELLTKAFTRRKMVRSWIDTQGGWLVVDAPSQAKAEDVLDALRQSLDSFPLTLLRTERSPASCMADWLAAGEAPHGFSIDMDAELRAITEDHAKVKYSRHSLDGEEVKAHLAAGKLPTRLAVTYDERISFILTDKLEIKRVEFLDVVQESLSDAESAQELFDAQIALMTGELRRLIPAVVEAMGGELA